MACTDGISKAITSDCSTAKSGGLEVEAWVFNRKDVSFTYDNTNGSLITNVTGEGFKITGVKKLLNSGFDIVQAENRADKWSHFFSFEQFEILATNTINVDNIDDVVIVVNRKDKTDSGEGVFVALGAKYGLWVSTDTFRENDANGARKLELKSLAGQEEPYSEYTVFDTDYDTTLALLNGLL